MSKLATISQNWKDPDFWTNTALPYFKNIVNTGLYRYYSRIAHGEPVHVVDEEWDNLVILDACRFDTFSDLNWLKGELEPKISKGCVTGDFLTRNFPNTYPDTVFVAGNPHASRLIPDRFHAFIPAWQSHWDDELGTVPPDSMAEAVSEASNEYPNKRIVAHFVQPHEPYIAPKTLEKFGVECTNGLRVAREMAESDESGRSPYTTIMARYRNGDLSQDEAVEAYQENLKIALEQVDKLQKDIPGKTVISSDHGEMFGEIAWPLPKRRIGHWSGVRSTEMVKVPWFILPYDERKKITQGSVQESDPGPEEERAEKLRSLGYLQ